MKNGRKFLMQFSQQLIAPSMLFKGNARTRTYAAKEFFIKQKKEHALAKAVVWRMQRTMPGVSGKGGKCAASETTCISTSWEEDPRQLLWRTGRTEWRSCECPQRPSKLHISSASSRGLGLVVCSVKRAIASITRRFDTSAAGEWECTCTRACTNIHIHMQA